MSLAVETRNEAFFAVRDDGKLGRQQMAIMLLVHHHPERDWSLQEISKALDMQISSVAGRVNELKRSGWLEEYPKRKCSVTLKTICPVKATTAQGDLFARAA